MANRTSFSCGEALDINQASSLYQRLQKSMQKSHTIELRAKSVSKVDTAGLQLLLALSLEAERCGGKIIWQAPSSTLISSARLLGMADKLGLQ